MIKEINILNELQIKKGNIYGGFVLKDYDISKVEATKGREYDYQIILMFHGEIAFLSSLLEDLNSKIRGDKIIYSIFNRYIFKAKEVSMNSIKMDNNFFRIKLIGKLLK